MINIAHFDNDPLVFRNTEKFLKPAGINIVRKVESLKDARVIIPTLFDLGVILALIDGDIGGEEIARLLAQVCPSIIRVGYTAEARFDNLHEYIFKTTPPDEFVRLVKLYTAQTT
ncbi:hypothetical protein KBD69_03580 [Candidatus Woesebacteria bacterium]|nr:hypothetical protein [Candidatus Woesebacteria bacterium]